MQGGADLSGERVLVVEDDFFLATDMAAALLAAGAEVAGPCPTENEAMAELARTQPSGAVVDVNLGRGPSFTLARALVAGGVPFVFMTGYDDEVIPGEFGGVPVLRKPADPAIVVWTLGQALRRLA